MPTLMNQGSGEIAEDRAHASGDEGFMLLAVRVDAAAALAVAGDYIPVITDANGKLWVNAEVTGFGAGAIGTVAIDQTTPGTTNRVAMGDSLDGPGAPAIDSYANAVIDLAASTADQQIIATPGANKQIWVYGFALLCDTAAGTIVFQDEDNTALTGTMAFSDEGGISVSPSGNFAMPIWKLPTNKALEADTGTCTVDGWINYAIVSV